MRREAGPMISDRPRGVSGARRGAPGAPGSGGVDPGAGLAALERAALVLRQATPDTRVLTRTQCPVQAGLHDGAAPAHRLSLLDLDDRRTRRPDREEELRVFVAAERAVAPVDVGVLLGVVYRVRQVAGVGPGRGPTPVTQRRGSATTRHCY